MYCNNCGTEMKDGDKFCAVCGAAHSAVTPTPRVIIVNPTTDTKSPLVAVILSFLCCGLGQVYNGQAMKGIMFLVLALIGTGMGGLLGAIMWLYGMYDAGHVASEK